MNKLFLSQLFLKRKLYHFKEKNTKTCNKTKKGMWV